jgi:RES domain-containing protein
LPVISNPRPWRNFPNLWAQAIYEAYKDVQGVHYPSSMHANRPAVALWERGAAAMPPVPVFHRPLLDPALLPVLSRVAHDIGYGLV